MHRQAFDGVEQRSRWLLDRCSDLAQYPIDAIAAACRKWRQSGSLKFPTPGQLIPLVKETSPVERRGAVQPWRQASPDEFASMSVRDKIRELTILAHEARSKAGPMFRNTTPAGSRKITGVHLSADQMPDTYRRWTAEAERLEAEVGRLRKVVSTPYREAAE